MLGPSALLAALRDSATERDAIAQIEPKLAEHRYLLLTTYKRDGTPIATPVWFAADGGRLVVATQAGAWKVKRLRRNGQALGAGCDVQGNPLGPTVELVGEVLSDDEHRAAQRAIDRRYGVSSIGLRQAMTLARRGARDYLALRPA